MSKSPASIFRGSTVSRGHPSPHIMGGHTIQISLSDCPDVQVQGSGSCTTGVTLLCVHLLYTNYTLMAYPLKIFSFMEALFQWKAPSIRATTLRPILHSKISYTLSSYLFINCFQIFNLFSFLFKIIYF